MPDRAPLSPTPTASTPCRDRYRAAKADFALAEKNCQSAHDTFEVWLMEAASEIYNKAAQELREARVALFRSDEPGKPHCPAHGTTPCLREVSGDVVCVFDQSKPEDGVLVGPPGVLDDPRVQRGSWHLVYRRPDGSEVVVPNGAGNQPLPWRIEHMRWQVERCHERAKYNRERGDMQMAGDMLAQADRLESKIREMEAELEHG
jgi:hypothetical protein